MSAREGKTQPNKASEKTHPSLPQIATKYHIYSISFVPEFYRIRVTMMTYVREMSSQEFRTLASYFIQGQEYR
jgi:hypothetical protein